MKCDQCQMISFKMGRSTIACHEIGCTNTHSRWDGEEWIRQAETHYGKTGEKNELLLALETTPCFGTSSSSSPPC